MFRRFSCCDLGGTLSGTYVTWDKSGLSSVSFSRFSRYEAVASLGDYLAGKLFSSVENYFSVVYIIVACILLFLFGLRPSSSLALTNMRKALAFPHLIINFYWLFILTAGVKLSPDVTRYSFRVLCVWGADT